LTPQESYLFDTLGFLVLKEVLSQDEVQELHGFLDDYDLFGRLDRGEHVEGLWSNGPNFISGGKPHMWDEPFQRLIVHPRIVPYLLELVGPKFRYDHGHAILMRENSKSLGLHGGGAPFDPGQYYMWKDNRPHNGLVAVAFSLVDAPVESGGFVAIPGSHKANVSCPDEFLNFDVTGNWLARVPVEAGDVVIFTEALTHGTWPWTADYERRAIFLKYSPGQLAYATPYPSVDDSSVAPPELERVLVPPYLGSSEGNRADTILAASQ
jgi:hypothetical protein